MQPVWLNIHSGRQFDATFETHIEGKSGLQVVEAPAFKKHSTLWVLSALYLAVPSSAMIYLTIDCHRVKCFCIYRLKCSKALSGWMDGMGLVWKSLKAPLLWALHCSAVLIIAQWQFLELNPDTHMHSVLVHPQSFIGPNKFMIFDGGWFCAFSNCL